MPPRLPFLPSLWSGLALRPPAPMGMKPLLLPLMNLQHRPHRPSRWPKAEERRSGILYLPKELRRPMRAPLLQLQETYLLPAQQPVDSYRPDGSGGIGRHQEARQSRRLISFP